MTTDEERSLAKLQEWADREDEAPGFMALYRQLLSVQLKVRARVSTEQLPSPQVVAERQQQGVPCLRFDDVAWNETLFQELFRQVVGILADHQVVSPAEAEALTRAAGRPSFLLETARSLYEHGVVPENTGNGMDHALLQRATEASMWPFLSKYAEALSPRVEQRRSWLRGTCPICGGRPDFGYLEREVGARWLMCSRCDARWPFRRIGCPFCGAQDQRRLSYLASEDEFYRLYLCDQCHSYLKVVDLRKRESEVLLPVERVLTLDMDRQAREKGYEGAGG